MSAVHKIMIDGTDVTPYVIDYEVDDTTEQVIDSARLCFLTTLKDYITITSGLIITVQRGVDASTLRYVHRGYIKAWTLNNDRIDIDSPNKLWKLAQTEVTVSFDKDNSTEAGILSEIIKTLVSTYGGLNVTSVSVPDSTSAQGQLLRKYICKNDNLLERIQTLAAVLNWQIRYDPEDDLVYVEPEGNTEYELALYFGVAGQGSYWQDQPKVEYDYDRIVNVVKIIGAIQRQEGIVESFVGDGAETEFVLSYTPEDTKVEVAGVQKTRGAYDQASGTYDYAVDQPDKKVVFVTAPALAADIDVTYTANRPIPVVMKDDYSITTYTNGEERQKSFTFNDIISVTDAELRGANLLSQYASPGIKYLGNITPNGPIILAGMSVVIRDDYHDLSETLVVRGITRKYPAYQDVVVLSDKRLAKRESMEAVMFRLEKLEKESSRNEELLRHRFDFAHSLTSQRRCVHFYKKGVSTTVGIYGNAGSQYGNGIVYGQDGNPEVLNQVWQGENIYREHAYDNLFIDTTNSTMVVDTALRRFT